LGRPSTLTPDTYAALLHAYRNGGKSASHETVSKAVGCSRDMANRVYQGHYASVFAWAPAIRDVVAGLIPAPTMPRVWPPPTLRLAPQSEAPIATVRPIESAPAASSRSHRAQVNLPESATGPLAEGGLDALAEYRRTLAGRVRALARAGPDIDQALCIVASAVRQYAESIAAVGVTARDLTEIAAAIKVLNAAAAETGTQLERMLDAEKRLAPSGDDAGKDDGFAEAARLAAERKRA
jgi:hypothetical protein